ncbi:MAG: preprotein translocase subunit SecE, partial [Pseudonocardiaceae bacterium]
MSDDRAHETADRLEQNEASSNAPESAAAVRRARPARRPTEVQGSGIAGKGHPTRARGATETKTAVPARLVRFLREVVSELSKV